uniref:Adaptor related protein complex 4 subunit mu 1 n=1 Tax=Cyprinus carpio TaxID=7962 RepID=A0A8C2G5Q3_CYPCA
MISQIFILSSKGDHLVYKDCILTTVLSGDQTPVVMDMVHLCVCRPYMYILWLYISFVNPVEMRIGLNEELNTGKSQLKGYSSDVRVDECRFHQAVKLDEFDTFRILNVCPSQGEQTVMQYQLCDELPCAPFQLFPSVQKDYVNRFVNLRCDLPPKRSSYGPSIAPVSLSVLYSMSQELSSPDQTAELQPKSKALLWEIPRFPGGAQLSALFKVDVPGLSSASLLEVGPVSMSFELPKQTCSGLQIRFLQLSPTQTGLSQHWVRYVTHSDSYIRI